MPDNPSWLTCLIISPVLGMENQFPGKKLNLGKLNAEQTERRRQQLEAFLQELFDMVLTPSAKQALEQFLEVRDNEPATTIQLEIPTTAHESASAGKQEYYAYLLSNTCARGLPL